MYISDIWSYNYLIDTSSIVTYIFHNLSIFLVFLVQYNFNLSELSTTFNCLKHIHSQIKEIAKDTNLHLNPVAQTFFKLVV